MVTVLLASYNGERFIAQQLDSLLAQTCTDFNILIHDDGSTDSTPDIIARYAARYPEKITVLDAPATGAAQRNFALLLSKCGSEYIAFCDQDDVWKSDKIQKNVSALKRAEDQSGRETPLLVHSDLCVADSALNTVSPSFFDFQGLRGSVTLPHTLVQNFVTGCTVMINRALAEKCGEIPEGCAMHDWWLALTALLFGRIEFIDEPLVLYRQHGGNQVGAKSASGFGFIKRKLKDLNKVKENIAVTYTQAELLLSRYSEDLTEEARGLLAAYCKIPRLSKCEKIKAINRYDFKKNTAPRRIGQYLLV